MVSSKPAVQKRGLPPSTDADASDLKRPRRSQRLHTGQDEESITTPVKPGALPSPLTRAESTATEALGPDDKDGPSEKASRSRQILTPGRTNDSGGRCRAESNGEVRKLSLQGNSTQDTQSQTQPYSQLVTPSEAYEVEDELGEGVWGYLVPVNASAGETLVLKSRSACPMPEPGNVKEKEQVPKQQYKEQEKKFEKSKEKGMASSGYLIGRHPECDRIVESPTVSNRHCLFFPEISAGSTVAILEDLSGNGTFVNDAIIGRNKRRKLEDGDEISIIDEARYCFRYPRTRDAANGFKQRFVLGEKLGKGHFASVYMCIEANSGLRYAVKKFEKRTGPGERSRVEGLQQEIAVLMGVSHPSLLCLKDTFDEPDGVYLILELANEGELFNWIVLKQKLSEAESRKLFVQLFQAVKYLHERNIVHRDIKPENILLEDKRLTVKLADFGLAKIIGEESFTSTLCGTPSYVAPEILQSSSHRRYTKAVDVWSLGVVLYICLCGFPPFSDELYDPVNNPYSLAQQILGGRFDYPSPYWDSVGDAALDLIDKMLTVDPDKRITIEDCLEHPWTTGRPFQFSQQGDKVSIDSTDGLVSQFASQLGIRRGPVRERTLLSEINNVQITQVIPDKKHKNGESQPAVKVFEKNNSKHHRPNDDHDPDQKGGNASATKNDLAGTDKVKKRDRSPASSRAPGEFMLLGGRGDQKIFENPGESNYVVPDKP